MQLELAGERSRVTGTANVQLLCRQVIADFTAAKICWPILFAVYPGDKLP